MIDAHCHLNFDDFEKDLDEVIQRAKKKGVEKIINIGTSIEYSKKAVELAKKYGSLFAIVGIHPHDSENPGQNWEEKLEKLAKENKVVGIGEIGLDYYSHNAVNSEIQKEIFSKQIEIAIKNNLPLQIHQRHAGNDVLDVLKNYKSQLKNPPGMFHCMSGDLDLLKKILDFDFYVGFDGNITYKGLAPGENTLLSDLVKYTPLEKIILETDAPYLTPVPYRGSKNEPSYVIIVADFIAKIKNLSFGQIASETEKNTLELFSL